jgi:hypothetical protein
MTSETPLTSCGRRVETRARVPRRECGRLSASDGKHGRLGESEIAQGRLDVSEGEQGSLDASEGEQRRLGASEGKQRRPGASESEQGRLGGNEGEQGRLSASEGDLFGRAHLGLCKHLRLRKRYLLQWPLCAVGFALSAAKKEQSGPRQSLPRPINSAHVSGKFCRKCDLLCRGGDALSMGTRRGSPGLL